MWPGLIALHFLCAFSGVGVSPPHPCLHCGFSAFRALFSPPAESCLLLLGPTLTSQMLKAQLPPMTHYSLEKDSGLHFHKQNMYKLEAIRDHSVTRKLLI